MGKKGVVFCSVILKSLTPHEWPKPQCKYIALFPSSMSFVTEGCQGQEGTDLGSKKKSMVDEHEEMCRITNN